MCRRFWVLSIVVALLQITNTQDEGWVYPDTGDRNAGNLLIRLIRATATSLYLQAHCVPECTDISWEYVSFHYSWVNVKADKVEKLGNDKYKISGLYAAQQYVLRAQMGRSFDKMRVSTCPEYVHAVTDIRIGKNGPGWLDIRWKPSRWFDCKQDFEYSVRHKVNGGNFSEFRTYGWYPIDDKGNIRIGPTQPCDSWPKEFCVLITEGVKAGKNHTVEILPRRIGGDKNDVGQVHTVYAYADPSVVAEAGDSGIHPECVIWAWAAVGASLFCIALIVTILVATLVGTFEKTKRLREEALNAENEENEENENEETSESAETRETTELTELTETVRSRTTARTGGTKES